MNPSDTPPKAVPSESEGPEADRKDATRTKLLLAAIDVFGRRGYEGATTRALAETAGVNLQAIPSYFGGKRGLYVAAALHIAEGVAGYVSPAREATTEHFVGGQSEGSLGVAESRVLLTNILQAMARALLSDESEAWARFLVREQMEPTEAFACMYEAVMKPVLDTIRRLVAEILGISPESDQARLRAVSLVGGILVFRMARAAAMRQLDWTTIGPRESEIFRTHVAELVRSIQPASSTSREDER